MTLMRRLLLCLVLPGLIGSNLSAQETENSLQIGVVFDGPGLLNQDILATIQTEVSSLLGDEFTAEFNARHTLTGDWSVASVEAALDTLLDSEEVDLVLTLGAIGTYRVARRGELDKPVIAPFAIDIDWQDLPFEGPGTGVANLNYLVSLPDFRRGMESLRRIYEYDHVAVLIFQPYFDAFPINEDHVRFEEREFDCIMQHLAVGFSAASATAVISDSVDAVYVMPLVFGWQPSEIAKLADSLIARDLPSFSYIGRNEVELGILAGLGPKTDWTRLARRVALNIQRILFGEKPKDLPVDFSLSSQLVINMATAREIGVYPNWDVMTEAELFNERRARADRQVSILSAVSDALKVNLDLQASERGVAAGEAAVGIARSPLLPQASVSASYRLIDKDRAGGLLGTPEGLLLGSGTLTQVLFSDEAWAGLSIEKKLQAQREFEHEAFRLGIMLAAATAYIDVLRAQTLEEIQKNNLQLSKENLELARLRERIGQSGPGEVYRWESQIATNRQAVVNASASRNLAEIQLNRLLNRPAEEPFMAVEHDLESDLLLVNDPRMERYRDDKWSFAVLRGFLTELGIELAPELKQFDALIAAQERARSTARRSFFLPTFGATASFDYMLSEHGAGSGNDNPLADVLPPGTEFEMPDDLNWSVGVQATLPLFEGGRRFSEVSRASREVQRLLFERDALRDRIEQNIRSRLHQFGAAYATVGFSRSAAEAAAKNLELVTDAYSRGRADILDLLDAQNAALVADLVAANAEYDYLVSYLQVQRAIGRFDFFLDQSERDAFFARMTAYFEAARVNGQ